MGDFFAKGNKPINGYGGAQHGLYEVWENPNPTQDFAGQAVEIEGDYDAFIVESGRPNVNTTQLTPVDAVISPTSGIIYFFVMMSAKITIMQREVVHSKSGTTNILTFGDNSKQVYATYGANPTTTIDNAWNVPMRIFGIKHND